MVILRRFVYIVDTINLRLGLIIMWATLAIAVLLSAESIMRYLFKSPFLWVPDLTMYIAAGFVLLCGGYCLLVGAHVSMDILRERLNLRSGAVLDAITSVFLIAFCVVLIWLGSELTWSSFISGKALESGSEWVVWPLRITVPIGASFLLLQGLAKLIRDLHTAIKGREME